MNALHEASSLQSSRSRGDATQPVRTKRVHDRRRKLGLCINGESHGKAFKGGRCEPCWTAKLDAEKEQRRKEREERAAERALEQARAAAARSGEQLPLLPVARVVVRRRRS